MKRILGATGIFAICAGSVSIYADDATGVGAQDVGRSLAFETTYTVRSSYKWADETKESLAYIAPTAESSVAESNSYKWDDAARGFATKTSSGELASAERSFQTTYKWGIKSDAEQSAYKWGIKSDAEQSAYKWGIKSDAEQSAYKWGIKSDAEQSAYKWGIKSDAEQSAYKWGIK